MDLAHEEGSLDPLHIPERLTIKFRSNSGKNLYIVGRWKDSENENPHNEQLFCIPKTFKL